MLIELYWLARLLICLLPYLAVCALAVIALIYVLMWHSKIERRFLVKRRSPK